MIRIIARHMAGGRYHEHIAEVKYRDISGNEVKRATRQQMVNWLDVSEDNRAIVGVYPTAYVYVGTIHPDNAPAYIRTYANGKWTDNLLSLEEY